MKRDNDPKSATENATQPFYYEIRVKGALSKKQWVDWVDDVTLSTSKGETTLRGVMPDHAALYALLGRLRDLAIPLLALTVLDARSRHKMTLQSRLYRVAIQLGILVVYLLLLGVLIAFTVALTLGGAMHSALAIALLFAAIGALSWLFSLWSGLKVWRLMTLVMAPASILTFLIFAMVTQVMHPAVGIGLILLCAAFGIACAVRFLRGRARWLKEVLAGMQTLGDLDEQDASNT